MSSLYIISLYDKNLDAVEEILVKANNLKAAEKKAGDMIPQKGKICGAGARTLRDYGLNKLYEQNKKETKMYHYTIPPMDGFIGTIRLNEFKKSLEFDKSIEESKYFIENASSRLIELEAEMSKAKHWQGDIRSNEIYVFAIPDEMETAIGLVWKQEDNGTTFIISPVELPHLQKYMESVGY